MTSAITALTITARARDCLSAASVWTVFIMSFLPCMPESTQMPAAQTDREYALSCQDIRSFHAVSASGFLTNFHK
jgi:hypothetical protein